MDEKLEEAKKIMDDVRIAMKERDWQSHGLGQGWKAERYFRSELKEECIHDCHKHELKKKVYISIYVDMIGEELYWVIAEHGGYYGKGRCDEVFNHAWLVSDEGVYERVMALLEDLDTLIDSM